MAHPAPSNPLDDSLVDYLRRSVTPTHAVDQAASRLTQAGFTELREAERWAVRPGQAYFVRHGLGALAAFIVGSDPGAGWTLAAAHSDSPGWKLKPEQQACAQSGILRVGTEVYGSPLHATWFDRPLAVAGTVVVEDRSGRRLVRGLSSAAAIFPNLAIHYNREANRGLTYDLTEQLSLLIATEHRSLEDWLRDEFGIGSHDWISADLWAVEPTGPQALGPSGAFVSPRIDNLTGCHAALEALTASNQTDVRTRAAVLFQHEEIGSSTWMGADSGWLSQLVQRVIEVRGGHADDRYRALADSLLISLDSAHARHPNWKSLHDDAYAPTLGGGPVIKRSARMSYSTLAESEAEVVAAAQRSQVPLQRYTMKSTLTPGSTIGPLATSQMGIPGVDLGIPIWAMHSAVETAHAADQAAMIRLVRSLFERS